MPPPSESIASDLRRILKPASVLSDAPSRNAYAIDAGLYRIEPRAVVLIESEEDLGRVIEYARRRGIPLTARSGGSNLTGSAIGEGIILEFSRFNRILELNRDEHWVRVQPGIVYAELNRELERHGLYFAPDPSSGEVCKIGGMLGTNAAGPHTLKYGAVKDNVHDLRVILADGRELQARPWSMKDPDFHRLLERYDPLRGLYAILKSDRHLIRSRRVGVTKNSSGYNLFDLADRYEEGLLDLPRLFIGSEGTLGITVEARLRLLNRPQRVVTAMVCFQRLEEVGEAVNAFLPFRPGAMEMMDGGTLDLIGRDRFGIPREAAAVLLIEFDEEPIDEKIRLIRKTTGAFRLSRPVEIAEDPSDQEALWKVRRAIFPTLYRYDGRRRPINFVDDVVVPAPRLTEMIAYLGAYFRKLNVPVAIYGHVGDGNAHINPLMDLRDPKDLERLITISREIHSTVIHQFGGSICGEHGDGRVRGEFLRELYGEELYTLFKKVKTLFDPEGLLNPGVKLTEAPFTNGLDIERLVNACATCGKCNAVCPVYDVTQEESNGARGWYHILTAPDYSYKNASRVVEACINCKSCATVCPAGLDVSRHVLERRAEHPNRLAGLVFALQSKPRVFEFLIKAAARTQSLWDTPFGRAALDRLTRPVLRRLAPTARLSPGILLPRLAARTLRERFAPLTEEAGRTGRVAYFHGCAANYFNDGVGEAVIRLMERQGEGVVLPRQRCSGTPIETYGHAERARQCARFNLESLQRYDTVVTGCASCTHMLKDYARLLPDEPDRAMASSLAGRVRHITEYLIETGFKFPEETAGGPQKTVAYHSSCHLRAAGAANAPRDLLRKTPGARFVEMRDADRCAGGAGTFLVKNPEQSSLIFERKRRAIMEAQAETVATSCPACMIQLRTGLQDRIPVMHVAQILDEACGGRGGGQRG